MHMKNFEWLVAKAIEGLPDEFLNRLENIDIMVEHRPNRGQLHRAGLRSGETMMGLYEGVPLTKRGRGYGLVPPDKITIFKAHIEDMCRDETEIAAEIQRVVKHEIAHHFGISDQRLRQIERY